MSAAVLVFSHLRWNFVYQRPQHLLSRLARTRRVLFVEEPMYEEAAAPRLDCSQPCQGVLVAQPVADAGITRYPAENVAALQRLVLDLLAREGVDEYLAWFYTPMAVPMLDALAPRAVVYDCMDELAAFKEAPIQMREREAALFERADLVLTGGPSLYEAKRRLHDNVHCFPSSVDAAHYAPDGSQANGPEAVQAQRLLAGVPSPRLGYFGVVDERLDLDLVAALADARRDWHVVMVGPVAKLDAAALPRRANLHWLGQQPYERLPALVADWDACLLPFALNEHTRFISPTKTLEYLAARKPVVGTPVKDMVDLYGAAVEIAADHASFIAACARVLHESPQARARRLATAAATVARYSWDETARKVEGLVDESLQRSAARMEARTAAQRAEGIA
jgi:glycosyltransferase involved in cell wall biosynthesis